MLVSDFLIKLIDVHKIVDYFVHNDGTEVISLMLQLFPLQMLQHTVSVTLEFQS